MENKYSQRTPRKQLFFYLDILDQYTNERLGHLGDISTDGMMIIITDHPFELNSTKAIRIQLPDFEDFPKKFLDCVVEARWAKPDFNPTLHCIGCRFINISDDDLPLIEQLQEVLGFSD